MIDERFLKAKILKKQFFRNDKLSLSSARHLTIKPGDVKISETEILDPEMIIKNN